MFITNTCAGTWGEMSDNGWSNTATFKNNLQNHFVKCVNPSARSSPILILFDGHKSHVNLDLQEWGSENNIIFFVLPPHTSHLLQPSVVLSHRKLYTTGNVRSILELLLVCMLLGSCQAKPTLKQSHPLT